MKKFLKRIIYKLNLGLISSIVVTAFAVSCTSDFEEYNRDEGEASKKEMLEGYYILKSFMKGLIQYAYPVQENNYQMTQNFVGDTYGRYFAVSKSGWQSHYQTFNAPDDWLKFPMEDAYKYVARNFFEIETYTKDLEQFHHVYNLAKILRITAFQRLTDMHGPLPYSKLRPGDLAPEYDDQETLYKKMFEELDEAIVFLTEYYKQNPDYGKDSTMPDVIYNNDYKKWVIYANTLKLRMAMRIRFADPALAKEKAESAVNHEFGVMMTNEDSAYNPFTPNGIYKNAVEWGDTRVCADIISYMNGYNDPRLAKYFTVAGEKKIGWVFDENKDEWVEKEEDIFIGVRSGITITSQEIAKKYSNSTVAVNDKMLIMPACEAYFLRAEGALLGWNMGGTAQQLYEDAIRMSFQQQGLTEEEANKYIADAQSKPASYRVPVDELLIDSSVNYDVPNKSQATIKWSESANLEEKLEKIITQKWIAIYPLGQEAWSEQRRTGYPKFFPVLVNLSGDASLTENSASRIPYPKVERDKPTYDNVIQLLGGKDDYATKLWWDKNPNKK